MVAVTIIPTPNPISVPDQVFFQIISQDQAT